MAWEQVRRYKRRETCVEEAIAGDGEKSVAWLHAAEEGERCSPEGGRESQGDGQGRAKCESVVALVRTVMVKDVEGVCGE